MDRYLMLDWTGLDWTGLPMLCAKRRGEDGMGWDGFEL